FLIQSNHFFEPLVILVTMAYFGHLGDIVFRCLFHILSTLLLDIIYKCIFFPSSFPASWNHFSFANNRRFIVWFFGKL
uniref:Ovule protein n=1 Tax=Parascaris univalens TaxID=6257 RepID=A0A915AN25_PARUN